MKKKMVLIITAAYMVISLLLLLATFAQPQTCHQYPSIECPFPVDPNVGRIISWMEIETGNEYKSEIRACDPQTAIR